MSDNFNEFCEDLKDISRIRLGEFLDFEIKNISVKLGTGSGNDFFFSDKSKVEIGTQGINIVYEVSFNGQDVFDELKQIDPQITLELAKETIKEYVNIVAGFINASIERTNQASVRTVPTLEEGAKDAYIPTKNSMNSFYWESRYQVVSATLQPKVTS